MLRITGSLALLAVSLFMLLGFFRSGAALAAPATVAALILTVVLPLAGAAALLGAQLRATLGRSARRLELRRRTLEAEVLRLAAARGGRITSLELAAELALAPDEAAALLTSFDTRGLAEVQITPSGVLVYSFHDIRHLSEKPHARGVLDA